MKILFFGITRDVTGCSEWDSTSDEKTEIRTVRELKEFLNEKYPRLQKISSLAVAVNAEYADDETVLSNSDEIALIPPVSGG